MKERISKCCNAPVGVKYDPEQGGYDWDHAVSYLAICSRCGNILGESEIEFVAYVKKFKN